MGEQERLEEVSDSGHSGSTPANPSSDRSDPAGWTEFSIRKIHLSSTGMQEIKHAVCCADESFTGDFVNGSGLVNVPVVINAGRSDTGAQAFHVEPSRCKGNMKQGPVYKDGHDYHDTQYT